MTRLQDASKANPELPKQPVRDKSSLHKYNRLIKSQPYFGCALSWFIQRENRFPPVLGSTEDRVHYPWVVANCYQSPYTLQILMYLILQARVGRNGAFNPIDCSQQSKYDQSLTWTLSTGYLTLSTPPQRYWTRATPCNCTHQTWLLHHISPRWPAMPQIRLNSVVEPRYLPRYSERVLTHYWNLTGIPGKRME